MSVCTTTTIQCERCGVDFYVSGEYEKIFGNICGDCLNLPIDEVIWPFEYYRLEAMKHA